MRELFCDKVNNNELHKSAEQNGSANAGDLERAKKDGKSFSDEYVFFFFLRK